MHSVPCFPLLPHALLPDTEDGKLGSREGWVGVWMKSRVVMGEAQGDG
jgi:hypothetical protein